jgi:hypothetical protein
VKWFLKIADFSSDAAYYLGVKYSSGEGVRDQCYAIQLDVCCCKRGKLADLMRTLECEGRQCETPYEENRYQHQINRLKNALQDISNWAG